MNFPIGMKFSKILTLQILIIALASCAASPSAIPTIIPSNTPSPIPSPTSSLTPFPSPTNTLTPTLTPTERPLVIVFFGDSVLKVGDVSKEGEVGNSIVDDLRADLVPADQIVTSNHGGRKAKWGFENMDANIFIYHPDIVTLWWGMNDLNGCPGIFDRDTNKILQYKLDAMVDLHVEYMKLQIDALLNKKISVIVITPMPVLGRLPWSHFGPNNELIWENDYRCDFNTGLEQLVKGQRQMVDEYEAEKRPVYLVDAWQIYKDHPNTDKMYMDIVHPGSFGARLIADGWLHVFHSMKRK